MQHKIIICSIKLTCYELTSFPEGSDGTNPSLWSAYHDTITYILIKYIICYVKLGILINHAKWNKFKH